VPKFHVPPGEELAAIRGALKATAHPTRQRILALLYDKNQSIPYGEIASRLGFKQAASIDQHLKRLAREVLIGNAFKRIDGRIRSVFFITDWGRDWMGRIELDRPQIVRMLVAGTGPQGPR
jgi:DNA-binding transcriptional ArsR family regulator